ncbi:hypothetical protein D3C80_1649050 [compost metagenome]
MGRRRARRDQCRANRTGVIREFALQQIKGGEEAFERPAAQGLASRFALAGLERFQAPGLIDAFGLVGKQYGITVKSNAQFIAGRTAGATGQNGRRSEPGVQRTAHVFGVG